MAYPLGKPYNQTKACEADLAVQEFLIPWLVMTLSFTIKTFQFLFEGHETG